MQLKKIKVKMAGAEEKKSMTWLVASIFTAKDCGVQSWSWR